MIVATASSTVGRDSTSTFFNSVIVCNDSCAFIETLDSMKEQINDLLTLNAYRSKEEFHWFQFCLDVWSWDASWKNTLEQCLYYHKNWLRSICQRGFWETNVNICKAIFFKMSIACLCMRSPHGHSSLSRCLFFKWHLICSSELATWECIDVKINAVDKKMLW